MRTFALFIWCLLLLLFLIWAFSPVAYPQVRIVSQRKEERIQRADYMKWLYKSRNRYRKGKRRQKVKLHRVYEQPYDWNTHTP